MTTPPPIEPTPAQAQQYRIHTTNEGEFLQFNDDGDWRYVPRKSVAYTTGKYMCKDECPCARSIAFKTHFKGGSDLNHDHFIHATENNTRAKMYEFTRSYPDITLYFVELQNSRLAFLENRID